MKPNKLETQSVGGWIEEPTVKVNSNASRFSSNEEKHFFFFLGPSCRGSTPKYNSKNINVRNKKKSE
jgi:hypothetical protein